MSVGAGLSSQLELKPHWSDVGSSAEAKHEKPAALLAWASAGVRGGIRAQYANEAVAAPEFRTDEIAVCAERFAQARDLDLEVLSRHNKARPGHILLRSSFL
jgi:hypothetical protein